MSVIVILIAIGIIVTGGFLAAFIWAVKSGQYDDTYSPAVRMLFDDNKPPESEDPLIDSNKDSKSKTK